MRRKVQPYVGHGRKWIATYTDTTCKWLFVPKACAPIYHPQSLVSSRIVDNLTMVEAGAEDIVLCPDTGRITGVITSDGQTIRTSAVVLRRSCLHFMS